MRRGVPVIVVRLSYNCEYMLSFYPKYLWVDMEMSGLEPRVNRILEFACVLTDDQLKFQQEGPHIIVHCDEEHLKSMDEWNTTYGCQNAGTTLSRD